MAVIPVKQLRGGELVRWDGGVGVVKAEYDGLIPAKAFVRKTEQCTALLGLKKRWRGWDELQTPIQVLERDLTIETLQ